MFAEVAIDISISHKNNVFTYGIPEGIDLQRGMWVEVDFNNRPTRGIVLSFKKSIDFDIKRLKYIKQALYNYPIMQEELLYLAEKMAQQTHASIASTLRLMLPSEVRRGVASIKMQRYAILKSDITQDMLDLAKSNHKRSKIALAIIDLLSDGKEHSLQEFTSISKSFHAKLNELWQEQLIDIYEKELLRTPGLYEQKIKKAPELKPKQKLAIDIIHSEFKNGNRNFLLYGVTGSGKTEVYLRLIDEQIQQGKTAIFLVPEIAITPQMVRWLRERFGNLAAVVHSGLSAGERYDEWRRIRMGDAKVVVGARSAIFSPLENIGLIVVDEEHESSYISDRYPQYDAREIAKMRASYNNACLILASATPSILSFYKASIGEYMLVEMPHRVLNTPLPKVSIVDMRQELGSGNFSIFSRQLIQKLEECLNKNKQAILFINKRGFASHVSCRRCGYVATCNNCDVAYTYHNPEHNEGYLKCHFCGAIEQKPKVCPSCGSKYIKYFGGGTQKVQDELHKLFPNIKSLRMDIDTTKAKNSHERIIEQFRLGSAQVLIGTQMIAKGLDFPNVALVGVVAADISLNLPDYKALEISYQLLTQVAGRAGRAAEQGEVVIQTYASENPTIKAAAKQDYREFFNKEIQRRRQALYPPFTQIVRILFEGNNNHATNELSLYYLKRIYQVLNKDESLKKACIAINQSSAIYTKIKNKYRYHILLKLYINKQAEELKKELIDLCKEEHKGVDIYYELNPITCM